MNYTKGLVILGLFASPLWLASESLAQDPAFREGTGRYRLSAKRAESLREYTLKAKRRIERVFEDIQGKSRVERGRLLVDAMHDIVPHSFENSRGSETLMRMVINKALELTIGIPGGVKKGVLYGTGNPDVILAILERSLRIAYEYADEDIEALRRNDLSSLVSRYLPLSSQYIYVAAMEFAPGIMNAIQEHDFYHSVFSFFLLLFDEPGNLLAEPAFGDIVEQLNRDLDLPEYNLGWRARRARNDDEVIRVVRNLRGLMKKLNQKVVKRYSQIVEAQKEGKEVKK